jgi:murein DD-endopeptidase MepM/ murein hydrolase activator NlpD
MLNVRATLRRRRWSIVAVVGGVTLAIVTVLVYAGEQRRKSLHDEVRWLRARLAERRTLVARQQRELEEIAAKVDSVVDKADDLRANGAEVRRLARMEGEGGAIIDRVSVDVDADLPDGPMSEHAARALEQLDVLEDQLTDIDDSVAVLTALLRDSPRGMRPGVPSLWPVSGSVSSGFGIRESPYTGGRALHTGVDIRAAYGTPVFATGDGVVTFAGYESGYGGLVVIDHGREIDTMYAHLSAIYVHEDQRIVRGQPIGAVGSSGRATGPHLHYEVRSFGKPVDPMAYLSVRGNGRDQRRAGVHRIAYRR